MSIGLSEFWTRLVREGILDAAGCKKLATEFAEAHQGTPPKVANELADFMVAGGHLTLFQSQCLAADPQGDLRLGAFRVRSNQPPSPMTRWIEVERIEAASGGQSADGPSVIGQRGFLLRTTSGNPWLDLHAKVVQPSLQPIEIEPIGEYLGVFSALSVGVVAHPGGLLADQLPERAKSKQAKSKQAKSKQAQSKQASEGNPRRACEYGIVLSDALSAMHAQQLIHGGVRADRVWIGIDGNPILLRDPAGPPVTGLGDTTTQWLDTAVDVSLYIAPELAATSPEASACTGASDIYSLGCLLFRIASGRFPFQADSVAETLRQHQTETPPELTEALAKGETGDPIYRVLAYALAKDPASRFLSVDQLSAALRAILPSLETESIETESIAAVEEKPAEAMPVKTSNAATPAQPESRKTTSKKSAATKIAPVKAATTNSSPQVKQPATKTKDSRSPVVASSIIRPKKPAAPKTTPSPVADEPATESAQVAAASPETLSDLPSNESSSSNQSVDEAKVGSADQVGTSSTGAVAADASDAPPAPADTSTSRTLRRRRKKTNRAPIVLTALSVVVLALFIALLVTDPTQPVAKRKQRPPIPAVIPAVSNQTIPTATKPSASDLAGQSPKTKSPAIGQAATNSRADDVAYQVVDDDGLLYAPPFPAGQAPAPLGLLPPGPAAIVSARLASILSSQTGKPILDALSPEVTELIDAVVLRSKVPVDWISRCSVGLFPGKDGHPEWSLAIELVQPQPLGELTDRWQVGASKTREGDTVYASDAMDADAFFLLASEIESGMISRYAVGPLDRISEVASIEGESIPLARSLRTLWNGTSDEADLVALVTPNFLFADGRSILNSSVPELVPSLRSVLIPNLSAMLITADADDGLVFGELRVTPNGGISEASLMRDIKDAIDAWPKWADQFVIDASPDPSWRLLASRLPTMMRFVSGQFRYGISDNVIVANTYLPASAVSQVSLATLLAANTTASAAAATTKMASAKPLTVAEMLDRKMSVSFDQESLEFAIDVIVAEFVRTLPEGSTLPPVRIIGGDLQKMGITQNQQIRGFAKTDLSLRTVLTDLVVGANPDKTATGPDDPKQALIWVVADDPANPGKQEILVTTRQAAENQFDLPVEFQPK
ncbi:serine/threonine protein kinase [Rubripirellula reticaptiva]|uniref:Serine/threonine-protein kinase PknB n=1 Tax=Rubripirellula reticaptiva TaxID=2528013 RepID=A0A5C6F2L1_9BACT|nr:hypothetical protein [Rubripirellula reticaptiva]TWU55548.1 Serine/threonine-protein kinase PknB [Rubripirellula reticaptiva]